MTRFLDISEMVLLAFFVIMDSIALLALFPEDTKNQLIVLVAGILLTIILITKIIRYRGTNRR